MRKVLNTIWTWAENGQDPSQKTLSRYLWNPQKQSFGPREIWPWTTASESLEQQNTSGSLRSEKSQTPGHEPKTAKTRAKKLFHVTFGIQSLEQQNTSPKASNSKTRCKTGAKSGHRTPLPKASNSKTRSGLGALDAKSPKHHLGHDPKTAKTGAKKLFHVTFGIHKNTLLGLAKSRLDA